MDAAKFSLLLAAFFCVCACAAKNKAPPAPPPPAYLEHTVRSGDTLGAISAWYTGNYSYWKKVLSHNPQIKGSMLGIGMKVRVPEELLLRRDAMPKRVDKSPLVQTSSQPADSEDTSAEEPVAASQAQTASPSAEAEAPAQASVIDPNVKAVALPDDAKKAPEEDVDAEEQRRKEREQLLEKLLDDVVKDSRQ